MKKSVTKELIICDVCDVNETYSECCRCKKNICYDCQKTAAVEYAHAVHFCGSGDGLYCNECDRWLLAHGDKRHAAYLAIERLKTEERSWYADFQMRCKAAEAALK